MRTERLMQRKHGLDEDGKGFISRDGLERWLYDAVEGVASGGAPHSGRVDARTGDRMEQDEFERAIVATSFERGGLNYPGGERRQRARGARDAEAVMWCTMGERV